ncbi:hypothetical protein LOTGIDRAFT_228776 [Lottia gigantea]|uniref:Transcription cofactor vestigial-like protein 4 n=1 Tax=Lottia gigantea TaxID=225164 RepID=V4AD93_LOTGI|nr:hypothetical protein LOTGIDRAFT_228776 [Lottia gigantea]ESO91301.1 hypothetical protein LOTGIDRAFT_228776 [Lottia gigantea]
MTTLGDYYFHGERNQYLLPPRVLLPEPDWRTTIFCEPFSRQLPMTHLMLNNLPPIPPYYCPWYSQDSLYKRSSPVDPRESPAHDYPSKVFKHDRPDPCTSNLHYDTQHLDSFNKKTTTAATQTQFTSFHSVNKVGYNYYPNPPPHPQLNPNPPLLPPPPILPELEEQHTPLNLSTNSKVIKSNQHSSRPSVITCATSHHSTIGQSHHNLAVREPSPIEVVVTDSAIEEHFRRSLGTRYSPSNEVPEEQSEEASPGVTGVADTDVSITGTVDDHFAKSLGDTTWTAIKAKNDLVALDLFSGTVDDHFAKALGGDTWLRIKAEKESNCSGNSSSSNSPPQVSLVTN